MRKDLLDHFEALAKNGPAVHSHFGIWHLPKGGELMTYGMVFHRPESVNVGRQVNRPDMGALCSLREKDKFEGTQFMRPCNELQDTLKWED
jgi:hypothetical protein